jgi:hypothetical protein
MIVVCTACSARFQYSDARFQGVRSKRFQCPKCRNIFEVLNPAFQAPPPPAPAPPAAAAPPAALAPPVPAAAATARQGLDSLLSGAGIQEGPMPPGMRFSLAFLTGPHASTVRVLELPVTILGREEGDVVINDPETSRRHARIEIHPDGTVWLTDLGSTNGTFTEGKPVTEPTQLLDRQEFSCGRSTFMLLIRTVDIMNPD